MRTCLNLKGSLQRGLESKIRTKHPTMCMKREDISIRGQEQQEQLDK